MANKITVDSEYDNNLFDLISAFQLSTLSPRLIPLTYSCFPVLIYYLYSLSNG